MVTRVVRVLGVLFDCSGVSAETWNSIATDVVHKATVASRFSLPQRDRAYIVKSVLCARLWFASRVALPPPSVVRHITSVIFAFLWDGRPELVARSALRMSRSDGGLSIPCLVTFSRLLALRNVLDILDAPDYPGRSLTLYWLSTHRRVLVPRGLGNSCPTAESPLPFYATVVQVYQQLQAATPDSDVRDVPVSRLCEALCEQKVPLLLRVQSRTANWTSAFSPDIPPCLADFHWRLGWGVLPTRDRLARWGVTNSNLCVNCGQVETNTHAVFECVVAKTLWTLVSRIFALPLSRHFYARHRSAGLVFAATCYVLWQQRNIAVGRQRRLGLMFPLLRRLRTLLLSHLEDALFALGEEEFLRRWHADFIGVAGRRVVLQVRWCLD
ncbi:unnamed protein product [Ixodes persulcatus]